MQNATVTEVSEDVSTMKKILRWMRKRNDTEEIIEK